MQLMDSHIHLDRYPMDEVDKLVSGWREDGIAGVVAVSMNLASAYRTLELKQRYPEFIYAAVGYHPEQPLPCPGELDELISLLYKERKMIDAVGEVGLPHYNLEAVRKLAAYRELLAQFALLSVKLDLPLVLHAVHDKAALAVDVLLLHGVRKAHFHWLKAPDEVVDRIIEHGYYISVTPEVCYRERDRRLARRVPLSHLLLETDGPWPHHGPFAGKMTTPLFLRKSIAAVAKLHGILPEEAAAASSQAVQNLYGQLGE